MANHIWVGRAAPEYQEDTIAIGGTWVAADTITIDLDGGPPLVLTIGSTAINDIGTDIVYMLAKTGSLASGSTVTSTGVETPEFSQLSSVTYDSSTSKVTIKGKLDGRPYTLNQSETSAAGTLTTASVTTPTGPHHADEAENWINGVPVTGGTVVFDERAQSDLKYALDQSSVDPAVIEYTSECTVNVGLPETNTDDAATPFYETLETYYKIGTSGTALALTVGEGGGRTAMGWVKLDTGTAAVTANVLKTGTRSTQAPLRWVGTGGGTWDIDRGDVELATLFGETGTITTLRVGYVDNVLNDVTLVTGSGCSPSTYKQTGGRVTAFGTLGTATITGGTVDYKGNNVSTTTWADIRNAAVHYLSPDTTAATVSKGGIFDCSKDQRSRTLSTANLFAGATWRDPHDTITYTAGLDLNQCTPDEVTLDLPPNKKYTLGSVT